MKLARIAIVLPAVFLFHVFALRAIEPAYAQSDSGLSSIEGVVKNLRTGEPLADVRVTASPEILGGNLRTATTDGEGRFAISGMPPGRYVLSAVRALFFLPRRNAGLTSVTVGIGERLQNIPVFMMPTGVIAGRVTDESREALRSVRVDALRAEYQDGARVWSAVAQSTSDDRGEYRLFNLQPGTYLVRVTRNNSSPNSPVMPLYYPGVPDPRDAVTLQVDAGLELNAIDVLTTRPMEYFVQMQLAGLPAGSSLNFAVQRSNSRINEQLPVRFTALGNEVYRVGPLTSGAYDVFIRAASVPQGRPQAFTHAGRIPVVVGREDEDLGVVALQPARTLSGKITLADPLPSPPDLQRATLTLRSVDLPNPVNLSARGNAVPGIDERGVFTLSGVIEGRYQVLLTGLPQDVVMVGLRAGGRDLLEGTLQVDRDEEAVEVVLGSAASVATLDGVVVNALNQPVPSTTVVLVPSGERRLDPTAYKMTIADQSGTFSFRSVLPGAYRVLAWEDVEAGAYMVPEFLKDFETLGNVVQAQKGTQNAVTVRVIPAQ